MDNSILDIIIRVANEYGGDAFGNMQRVNAILLDLAPGLRRERILVRNFVELDGYDFLVKTPSYPLAERKLVQSLVETFCLERAAALWVVRLFAVVTGHLDAERLPLVSEETICERVVKGELQSQVSIGKSHVAAVASDGAVFAGGDNAHFQCDVGRWRDIVAVAAGDAHTLGLRADGKVLAAGSNAFDQCDVSRFSNVRAVYASGNDSVFVLADGSAVSVGRSKFDLSAFENIAGIAFYPEGVIGIRTDGALQLAGYATEEDMAHENAWLLYCKDVSQVISTYVDGSVILTSEGRIYKSLRPENYFAQWYDIVSIVNLADSFAILCKDGTVRVLPYDRTQPRIETAADDWEDIAAIYGGYKRLIGLTKTGNLLFAYTHIGWLWSNKAMEMDYILDWEPVGAYDG